MAFERLQAEIGMLINQIGNQPEDLHELYEMLHQKLAELRATGHPLPQDLVELEQKMQRDFPQAAKPRRK
jgi:predicted  nucleic acid-binding Zn-ribbon protein